MKFLISLLVLSTATPALAQVRYTLARKIVTSLKINLQDEWGSELPKTEISLVCNSFPNQTPRTATTNKSGSHTFTAIKQNSVCAVFYQGKNLHQFSFRDFEPHTVTDLELDIRIPAGPKQKVFRNQVHSGEHKLKVHLYKHGKRGKAYKQPVAISCLGEFGYVHNDAGKSPRFQGVLNFEGIPSGAECFIRAPKCTKEIEPMGFVNFFEGDRSIIRSMTIHINIPKCSGGGGQPDAEEPIDEPGTNSGGSTSTTSTTSSQPDPKVETEESDPEDKEKPKDSKSLIYKLNVYNKTKREVIANKDVTIYSPSTGKKIAAQTDAQGVAMLSDEDISPDTEYLVFLGSEEDPIATLNMTSKVQYSKAVREQTAEFEVDSIRHHFEQNRYELDPKSTTIAELDQLALVLKQYPKLRVVVEGYTNSDADDMYNMRLSRKRAEAIANYLISKGGIAADRVDVKYFGETKLLYNADKTEDKERSRRVEVKPDWDSMLVDEE